MIFRDNRLGESFRRRRAGAVLGFALLVSLLPAPSRAAIFDALQYVDAITTPGWFTSVDLSGDHHVGNVSSFSVDGGATAAWRWGAPLVFATVNGGYGEADDRAYERHFMEHLRYRYYLSDHWAYEAFGQHEVDSFRRIELRALGGLGPRWQTAPGGPVRAAVGVMPMYEFLRFSEEPGVADSGRIERQIRISLYHTLGVPVGDHAEFVLTLYVQPRVDEPDDLRASGEAGFGVEINDWLDLLISSSLAYDATPPVGVDKLTVDSSVGLGLRFGRSY